MLGFNNTVYPMSLSQGLSVKVSYFDKYTMCYGFLFLNKKNVLNSCCQHFSVMLGTQRVIIKKNTTVDCYNGLLAQPCLLASCN